MNTLAARLCLPHAPPRELGRGALALPDVSPAPEALPQTATSADWIERLAEWADRQSMHRRNGSWVLYR